MIRLTMLIVGLFVGFPAMAQEYPKKQPIKIIVPFNPGGLTDLLARITAEFLQRRMEQAVVVENRPGASGAIAADYVSKAAPDGYTLMLTAADIAVLPAVRNNLPYKLDEFTYLTKFWTTGTMIVVGPRSAISTAQELIAQLKANPGKLRYGSTGVASLNHLGTAKLEGALGAKGVHVPYSGAAPVQNDLLAGTIDFYTGASLPFPANLKVLAPAGTRRHGSYPDLPTLEELGYKNASYDAWFGLIGPPKLSKPIVDRLNAELRALYKDPEAIAKFKNSAKEVPDENLLVGEDFRQYVLQENKTWREVAEREKITVQQ